MKRLLLLLFFAQLLTAKAQQFNGMSGLIHNPSAEMNNEGDAHIGFHWIDQQMMPDKFLCPDDEGIRRKYDSFSYYLNLTPFKWVEVAYTCVLFKYNQPERKGYKAKDRHFAIKFNPLKEGEYYPAIAVGADDFLSSNLDPDNIQGYFANYWIASTKHFFFGQHEFAAHLGYRYYLKDWNKKYNGVNGAVTYRPGFYPKARAIVEYDGCYINYGVDALLFNHLFLQVSFHKGMQPSAGITYQVNLGI